MNDGELYRKIYEVLSGRSTQTLHEVIEEAKEEFLKIEEKAVVEINKTNRDAVLSEYAKSTAECTRKWFGH